MNQTDDLLYRRGFLLLSLSVFLLLAHAFIPTEEFIHRCDDAYYYFKVAVNYSESGFWSFDGIHPTNGVQPLWAVLLTGVAQVSKWVGVTDPDTLARVFVGLTALVHFASSMVLYHFLARKVSTGTAIAAAGAFLFPMGIVWARVWGMENSLYALLLLSTISYFHLVFLERTTARTALLLGVLLGLTVLARLNMGVFVACLLLYSLYGATKQPFAARLRYAVMAGTMASLLVVPYFLWNYQATGHVLPISGSVKAHWAEQFLASKQIDNRFSLAFLQMLWQDNKSHIGEFMLARCTDGLWVAGGRLFFVDDTGLGASGRLFRVALFALFALVPFCVGRPFHWLTFLRTRFGSLAAFSYVLLYGVADTVICVFLYPNQLGYAMKRWWMVENEIILVVVTCTLVAAALSYVAVRLVPPRFQVRLVTAALVFYLGYHAQEMARFYWDHKYDLRDWNTTWNDESYRAACWLSENLPADARVGSWNAGVVGYYAKQKVVNLDGLINNFELLSYLRQGRVSDYIVKEKISYLSDMESIFAMYSVHRNLQLTEVYSHYCPLMRQHYRIYKVETGETSYAEK